MGKSLRRRPPSSAGRPPSSRLRNSISSRRSSGQSSSTRSSPATPQSKVRKHLRVRASTFAAKSARRTRTRRQLQADLDSVNLSENITPPTPQSGPGKHQSGDDAHDESIDKLLRDVRTLMRSNNSSAASAENGQDDILPLRNALKRADDQFRQDDAPADETSSASTAEAAREELGIVDPVPSPPKSNKKKAEKGTPIREQLSAKKSKKPPRTPQTERLARFRARLEKSRLTPEACPKPSSKDADDSDVEMSLFDHKEDIEALKKDDPEFYKFLEENDAALLDVDDLDFGADLLSDLDKDDDVVNEDESEEDIPDNTQVVKRSGSSRSVDKKKKLSAQGDNANDPKSAERSSTPRREHPKTSLSPPKANIRMAKDISGSSPAERSDSEGEKAGGQVNVSDDDSDRKDSSSENSVEDDVAENNARIDNVTEAVGDRSPSGEKANRAVGSKATQTPAPSHRNSKSPSEKRSAVKSDKPNRTVKVSSTSDVSESSSGVSGNSDGGGLTTNKETDPKTIEDTNNNVHVVLGHVDHVGVPERPEVAHQLGVNAQVVTIHSDSSDSESAIEEGISLPGEPFGEYVNGPAVVIVDDDGDSSDSQPDGVEDKVEAEAAAERKLPVQPSSAPVIHDGNNAEVLEVVLENMPPGPGRVLDATPSRAASSIERDSVIKSPEAKSEKPGSDSPLGVKSKKRISVKEASVADINVTVDGVKVLSRCVISKTGIEDDTGKRRNRGSSEVLSDIYELPEKASEHPPVSDTTSTEEQKGLEEKIEKMGENEVQDPDVEADADHTGYSSDDDSEEERLEEVAAAVEAGIVIDRVNAVADNSGSGKVSGTVTALPNELELDGKTDYESESSTDEDDTPVEVEKRISGLNADGGNDVEMANETSESDNSDVDELSDDSSKGNGSDTIAGNGELPELGSDEDDADINNNENEGRDGFEKKVTLDGEVDPAVSEQSLVDLKYLRSLKELIDSHRAGVKVCKRLLLIFQSGRDVLPNSVTSDGNRKLKSAPKGGDGNGDELDAEPGSEIDEYEKDGTIKAGKLKFVSAKAYQQAMNLAIIGLQDVLDTLLGKPTGNKVTDANLANWIPSKSGRWGSLQPLFRGFVYNMLGLCDSMVDAPTLRFLLKRLERMAPYTFENENLSKKVLRAVLRIWSSDLQHVSQETRLQAYLVLNKLAHVPGNTELVLRFCFNSFISNIAPVCNPKTFPLIRFAIACIVELYGIDMGASYSTLFSYLREMAVTLRSVLVSKDELEDIEKVHNWKFINELRLWSRVLGKHATEDGLQPLIYPYVQVALGVMGLHLAPRAFPLRLHVASFLIDLVQETGVYIPVVPNLLVLLRCSELKKHPKHSDVKDLEWRALLRVNEDTVKSKGFLTGLVDGVGFEVSRFFTIISKHVSFPELSFVAESALRKAAKSIVIAEWRSKIIMVATKLKATADEIVKARAKADFAPQGAISERGMLACVPGVDPAMKMPIERLFEVERDRMQKQDRLRDEVSSQKRPNPATSVEDEEKMESSSSYDESRAVKKVKTSASEKVRPQNKPSLQVPDVHGDDEQDQVSKLDLDSDSSAGE